MHLAIEGGCIHKHSKNEMDCLSSCQQPSKSSTYATLMVHAIDWVLCTAQDPRQPHNDQAVITNTLAGCLAPFPSHISPAARELVLRMLQSQPEKRPSLEEIAVHPWLTQRLHLQTLFALEVRSQLSGKGLVIGDDSPTLQPS